MSFQAMAWAISQKAGSTTNKLVLLALANYADDKGECYPSRGRLAFDCECSVRTIDAAISALEEIGLLSKRNRFQDGKQGSNTYQIMGANSSPQKAKEGSKFCTGGVQSTTFRGADVAHRTYQEPIIEPIKEQKKKIKHDCPSDFTFTENHFKLSSDSNLNIDDQFQAFTDYHKSKGNKFVNWESAFSNWLRKAAEFKTGGMSYAERDRAYDEHRARQTYAADPADF